MDANDNQQIDGLENQVRNMILNSPSSPQHVGPPQATGNIPPVGARTQNQHAHANVQNNALPPRNQHSRPSSQPLGRGYASNEYQARPLPPNRYLADGRGTHLHASFQRGGHQTPFSNRGRGRGFHGGYQAPRQYPNHLQPIDPATLGGDKGGWPPPHQRGQLYQPYDRAPPRGVTQSEQYFNQGRYLDAIAMREIPIVEMGQAERDEKESFRKELEKVCQEVCATDPERLPKVSIEGFGSFESGFASAGSDMDLVLVVDGSDPNATCFSPLEDDLPRSLEKRLLQLGYGAHLLTRTRVPIIKVCQTPGSTLLSKLRAERENWDRLDRDLKYPHLKKDEDEHAEDDLAVASEKVAQDVATRPVRDGLSGDTAAVIDEGERFVSDEANFAAPKNTAEAEIAKADANTTTFTEANLKAGENAQRPRREPWTRERKAGPLDFPKDGVGIQTDINFFNPLGIHNTQMLRCYSLCDSRVRPMILFIKSWAKRRKINSSYSGTLSSYGYVLMALHYLINVARPPVLPNLQHPWRPHDRYTPHSADRAEVEGWEVDFWRREDELKQAAHRGTLTRNEDTVGKLLAGFFQYYSSQGGQPSFHWMGQVLSLRSFGGILTKEEKGWVKAVTEQGAGKQVQHRYLFAIEDPFELTHNVARTVTHNGIVAIRDEFRRAHRILRAVGNGYPPADGELFDQLVEEAAEATPADVNPGSTGQAGQQHRQSRQAPTPRHGQAPLQAKSLDVTNIEAFPSLGAAKPKQAAAPKRLHGSKKKQEIAEAGEISGEKAKAFLEELKRKKAEGSEQAN